MSSQKQIDDLLNDSLLASSSANVVNNKAQESQGRQQIGDSYANEDFEDYQESRQTNGMRQSRSEIQQSRQMKKKAKLSQIKQEPLTAKIKKNENKGKQVAGFKTQENFKNAHNKQQTNSFPDKLHLTHNYARLQQRERQLLLTTLSEQNRQLKSQLSHKNQDYQVLQGKYKLLLEEKGHNNSTAKELALEKKVSFLEEKLKKMNNLKKIEQQKNKYATKISNKPQNFVPEEEVERREGELLELIDKLKQRLIQSDQNMGILQKKLHEHEHVEYNDELHRKMKRVEQLQFKIQKMVSQAETDRNYIELLKQKIKESEQKVEKQKNKYSKLQIQLKRLEMGQYTHSDIMQELKETRKQKQMLEKSLKQLSSAMMSNVRKGMQKKEDAIEDSNELLKC